MTALRDRLAGAAPLIADGGIGTGLQRRGLKPGECGERWNLDFPERVADLARAFADAGSELVYTNTFGANRLTAKRHGLADQVSEVNAAGVAAVRQGVGEQAFVIGSIGPTGEMLEPFGDLTEDEAYDVFLEQATALAEAEVDGIVVETFTAIEEARAALRAAREAARERPVFATMSFDSGGRTIMGVTPESAVGALLDAGADVTGANCSIGPEVVGPAIRAMKETRPEAALLAKPNAGLPALESGEPVYPLTPEQLAAFALEMAELGVAVIGGCCGTRPEHIAAVAEALGRR